MKARKVILAVDDELAIRVLIRRFLIAEGYEVLVAVDGLEAALLSEAYEGSIDLLLTDVEMPRLDGVSAYLRISAVRNDMKVLFMSGGTFQSDMAAPWPFLSKPFQLRELIDKVHKILQIENSPNLESMPVILVVDRDQDRIMRTKAILAAGGYRVLTANTVEEAEATANHATRIDLIVSEVLFSGDSGVQLAEREASRRNIETLLISHVPTNVLSKVPEFSGQKEFLANPFTPEELLMRVHQLLHA